MTCDKCGAELEVGSWPFCKGSPSDHVKQSNSVIGDEIDITVEHGLTNLDGTPRRYTSREELNKEAKKRGYTNYVVHVPEKGSDKSKHTTRWI